MNNYVNNPFTRGESKTLAQAKNFFTGSWGKIVAFFSSYQWREIVFTIKIVFIVISFLLFLAVIGLLIRIIMISPLERALFRHSKSGSTPVFSRKKINKRLGKVEKRLHSGLEANYKLAVLEAEKIFDRVIKEIGYGSEKKLPSIEEIKQANKIKKNIIEDKKYKLSKEEAKKATEADKRGLKELGVL